MLVLPCFILVPHGEAAIAKISNNLAMLHYSAKTVNDILLGA